jgi:hypothetical protein
MEIKKMLRGIALNGFAEQADLVRLEMMWVGG